MRRILRAVSRDDGEVEVDPGCLACDAPLRFGSYPCLRVETPLNCPACGAENAVEILDRGTAAVRRPYGARAWRGAESFRSSNVAAVGRVGRDLVVRFVKGGVYRYPDAGALFREVVEADSVGRAFAALVRPRPAVRLCAAYGCLEPAEVATNQVLCERHLSHSD